MGKRVKERRQVKTGVKGAKECWERRNGEIETQNRKVEAKMLSLDFVYDTRGWAMSLK